MTSITIPNTVTSVDDYAFYNCYGLTSITIPNTVTYIDDYAFCNCYGLTSVTIPNSVTNIGESAFGSCTNLISVTIPNSVTSIGTNAFYECKKIKTVTIPNSVINIGANSFHLVKHVEYYGTASGSPWGAISMNGVTDGDFVFSNAAKENLIAYIGQGGAVTIPSTTITIDNNAFSYCSDLTSVVIPNSVVTIGNGVFYQCDSLVSIIIPNSVNSIGINAFYQCGNISSIIIPNSVTFIGNQAFYQCSSLTSIIIPDLVTNIGNSVFSNCTSLSSVTIPNSVTSIGANAFYGCTNLVSVTIPNSVTTIGSSAFAYCSGLTEIISLATVVPALEYGASYVFYGVNGNIPVYIPCGSMEAYLWNWGGFFSNYIEPAIPSIYLNVMDNAMGVADILTGPTCDSIVVIKATANYGYHFTQWNDGNTNNPRTVSLIQDTSFVASFVKNQYTVTGTTNDSVRGTVCGSATVDYLDSVTLTAIANNGYHFTRWNDYTTVNPRHLVATNNITKMAIFDYNQYNIFLHTDTNIHGNCVGGGSYCYLSEREITAYANYGYHFTQWSDGDTNNPRVITLTQDTSFTALFAKNRYDITLTADTAIHGSVTGAGTYEYFDSCTLSATANYGYHFIQWNDGDTNNPRVITLTQDTVFTAYFTKNWYTIIGVSDNETMGYVSGSDTVEYLDSVSLSATSNYGFHFSSWNDGDTSNPRVVCIAQDTLFTALFAKNTYNVVAISADTIQGNVIGSTTMEYLDTMSIVATANYGYHFSQWNDGDTSNPRVITLTQDTAFVAMFAKNTYTLTGLSADTIRGSVTGCETTEYLDTLTLTAAPNYGYHFTQWNDGDTSNPRVVCITQDTTFTAFFAKNQYTLTVQSNDETQGCVSEGGVFDYLDTATIVAAASEHYHFVRWNDGNTDNPREYVIVSDVTLTAIFAIDTHTVSVTTNDIARGMAEATGTEFSYGTPCTVTAIAYTGYVFSRWSNGITANPYTFAVLDDVDLTAIFEEEGTQGISNVGNINGFNVYTRGRSIHINGIEGQHVSVYSVDGRIIATKHNANEQETILVPSSGVYFIKVGEYPTRKVIVVR